MRRVAGILTLLGLLVLAAVILSSQPGAAHPGQQNPGQPKTTVVLTFDDGLNDQYINALPALRSRGIKGTFFVNTTHLGSGSRFMTWSQLRAVAGAGNEIGGHTLDHLNLRLLPAAEATREICNDRVNLIDRGFSPTDFAYPFGAYNAGIEWTVRRCGYASARVIGGIVSAFDGACLTGCPYAETTPPRRPYTIASPDSVTASTTVSDLETLVTQAQAHGGGLVPIVFHDVCDNACSQRSISRADFGAFLDWLHGQASAGAVSLRTMHEVIGGTLRPPVPGPPPSGSSLQNPSLERDTSGGSVPDCWQADGWGTNVPSLTRTSAAHSGRWAEQLTVSGYQSGDETLMAALDQGQCAPAALARRPYGVGTWYRSTAPMSLYAYYRDGIGAWHWFATSHSFPASSRWRHAAWTTPALPAGATSISFGPGLATNGTLTIDDLSLAWVPARRG